MKLSKVLIYLGILGALAAYVYVVEIQYKQKQETEKREQERIVRVDKDKIHQIELKSKDGSKIELKKIDGQWVLTEPVKVKADEGTVQSLLTSVSESQFEKVLKEKDIDWAEYGLDKPDFTITVGIRDDSFSLFFGSSNPAKTSYYLRAKGDPRLLLVADTLKTSLNKTLFQLRDKTVFGIAPTDVDRVVVARDGQEIELEREGPEKWLMLKPEKMRVKGADVNRNLITLTNLQAKDIIDDFKQDNDPYGLNNPWQTIVLKGKNRTQTLQVGKAKEDKEKTPHAKPDRYARIQGQDMVHVIAARALDDFTTDPDKLRDKYLMAFKPSDVERLEVDLDGTKWLAVRSEDEKWTLEKPTKKENVESWPVTGILWDLKNLEWKDMKKQAPDDLSTVYLDKPQFTISVSETGEKHPLTLKAGWKEEPAQSAETAPENKTMESSEPESNNAGPESKADEKAPIKRVERPEPSEGHKVPKIVNAIVQPHEEGNALFTVDSSFIERLRKDLKRLAGETKK